MALSRRLAALFKGLPGRAISISELCLRAEFQLCRVPRNAPLLAIGNIGHVARHSGAVAELDVLDGLLLGPDAFEEVPEVVFRALGLLCERFPLAPGLLLRGAHIG